MLWRSWVWNGLPQKNCPVAFWMNGYCRCTVSPLDNELRHSSQRFMMRSPSLGMHPTHPVPLLPLPSLRSTAQKKKVTTACLPSTSQWPRISAKVLRSMDESNPNPAAFSELRSATDLALRTTKMTAQAIGRSMPSLVVLERYLWLNLTEMKDVDKIPFLDSPTGLFGPAVEGFAEYFTATQKSSQAMWHFLPKCSSSTATSQDGADSATSKSCAASCSKSRCSRTTPQKVLCLLAPCSVLGAAGRVFVKNYVVSIGSFHIAPTQPIAVIARKIKTNIFKKRTLFLFPLSWASGPR